MESLRPYQTLHIPPGNYTSIDCGMDVHVDNIQIKASSLNVVIDCAGKERHFTIRGFNVTIEGLFLINGAAVRDDCTVDRFDCSDTLNGGCMLVYGNYTVVRNSTFVNCLAAEHGGAISISNMSAVVSLEGVSILHSEASHGGGVWSRGSLNLNNCTLNFNSASFFGGAVFVQGPNAFLTARHSSFSHNFAYESGGGISMMVRNESNLNCVDVPDGGNAIFFECNMNNNWAASFGGAILVQDGFALSLDGQDGGMQLVGNSAGFGGFIFGLWSNISISGNISFLDNVATFGGAMYLTCSCDSTIVGSDIRFENNTASADNQGLGGGICISAICILEISGNVSFVGNQAIGGLAGAIYGELNSLIIISGNISFIRNVGVGYGAILNCFSSLLEISGDVQFLGNVANSGAVIGNYGDPSSQLMDTVTHINGRISFSGNQGQLCNEYCLAWGLAVGAPSTGGGIYLMYGIVTLFGNVSFERNIAGQGGAIYADFSTELIVGDSVSIRGGTAGSGGAIYLQGSTTWLGGNVVIEGNVAETAGGLLARFLDSVERCCFR